MNDWPEHRAPLATDTLLRCNRCHRPMAGTDCWDGACACGGLIEAVPIRGDKWEAQG
jgi:hypothetical protein